MIGAGGGAPEGGGAAGATVSVPVERTTGFCASTGPCAAGPVLLGSGLGRLHPLTACARAATDDIASAIGSTAHEMILPLPLMIEPPEPRAR